MRKGFVLTMDAMLALIVAAVFIATIIYYINAPKLETEEYLYMAGGDFLAVADKDGAIVSAMEGQGSRLTDSIAELPGNLCRSFAMPCSTCTAIPCGPRPSSIPWAWA